MYGLAHQTIHIKFILKENSTENANGHRCAMLLPWCHRRSNGRKCWHKQSKCKCPRPAQYRSRISMHRMDNKIYTFSVHVMENRFKNLQTNSDFMHVGFVWLSLFLYEKTKIHSKSTWAEYGMINHRFPSEKMCQLCWLKTTMQSTFGYTQWSVLVGAQSRAKMYENTKRGKHAMEMTAYGWNGQQMSRNNHKNNNNFNELNFTVDSINRFNNLALYWSHLKSTFQL